MERPNRECYFQSFDQEYRIKDYIEALEKYCDWLEDEYNDIEQIQIDLRGSLKHLKRDIETALKTLNTKE